MAVVFRGTPAPGVLNHHTPASRPPTHPPAHARRRRPRHAAVPAGFEANLDLGLQRDAALHARLAAVPDEELLPWLRAFIRSDLPPLLEAAGLERPAGAPLEPLP